MATHSSILAWKIPWTEELGRLQFLGSLRVGHDWVTSLSLSFFLFFSAAAPRSLHFHFPLSRIGEENGNPLQCSCLENPRDGGAWWAAVYGVTQSRPGLKRLSSSSSSMWLILAKVPYAPEKICILLLLDGVLNKYQLNPSGLMYHLQPVFPFWFCLYGLSIDVSGMLKSPTIALLLISPFIDVGIHLRYWSAPMFAAYVSIIVVSSYWIDPLNIMQSPSLCQVAVFI